MDGCAVFVPNAAPDEEYDLRITHVGRHAAYGRIERILTASPDRCTRLCPDAKRCGGCDFWHLRYPAECRIKAPVSYTHLILSLHPSGCSRPPDLSLRGHEVAVAISQYTPGTRESFWRIRKCLPCPLSHLR